MEGFGRVLWDRLDSSGRRRGGCRRGIGRLGGFVSVYVYVVRIQYDMGHTCCLWLCRVVDDRCQRVVDWGSYCCCYQPEGHNSSLEMHVGRSLMFILASLGGLRDLYVVLAVLLELPRTPKTDASDKVVL